MDAIRFEEIEREFEGMRGQFSGAPPRLRSILVRMLEADCKQDLARLLNEVQTKLNDPAHLQQAWAKHEKRAKGSEAAAKKRRLEKLFNVTLVRAVEDGVEEEELVDAFRTAMAKQIMDV